MTYNVSSGTLNSTIPYNIRKINTQRTQSKKQATLVDPARKRGGLLYTRLGPHEPGYRLAGSPVSCRQLEADAGTVTTVMRCRRTRPREVDCTCR